MKRFKFFKILYYGFMITIGLLLCLLLPSYNQYNALIKALKSDINDQNYGEVPGFFSSYYNDNPLVNVEIDESRLQVFEAINYGKLDEQYFYAQNSYMVFLYGVQDFDIETSKNDSGDEIINRRIVFSDGTNSYTKEFEDTALSYRAELDLMYFYISQNEFTNSNLDGISAIQIYDESSLFVETTFDELSFGGAFFEKAKVYNDLYNQMYYNLNLTLNGKDGTITYNKDEGYTTLNTNAKITYTPSGTTQMYIDADSVEGLTIEGATKVDGKENTYQLTNSTEVVITATAPTSIRGIEILIGDMTVRYALDGQQTGDYNHVLEQETVTDILKLAPGYTNDDETNEAQNKAFNEWLENYEYAITSYNDALNGVATKTIIQIVLYVVIFLVIGDFLVGNRHILALIGRITGKRRKTKEPEIVAEYDVNVACAVHVPVGYNKPVHIIYKKDDEHIIDYVLEKEHNYKFSSRVQCGKYVLVEASAEGLHPIKKSDEIQIRGYKYDLVINFAYDDKKNEQTEDAVVVEATSGVDNTTEVDETSNVNNSTEDVVFDETATTENKE